ncbi:MAG: hypothetical protein SangKO_010950 [Sandaracinaceae bacterium]
MDVDATEKALASGGTVSLALDELLVRARDDLSVSRAMRCVLIALVDSAHEAWLAKGWTAWEIEQRGCRLAVIRPLARATAIEAGTGGGELAA